MSLRDRLICFADFVGMTLLALCFLLPLPNRFFKVCLPTLFAAVLKFFLPIITSATSGTANSNKSAPTHSAAGTIFSRKNGIAVPQYLVQVHRIPVHVVDQHLYRMESLLFLKQTSCNVFWVRNECWKLLGTSRQEE